MITSPYEYWSLLYRIQDANNKQGGMPNFPMPIGERVYNIDLLTREVEAPESLGIQYDAKSEWIYFRCPRFIDNIDLTQVCCVIQYKNANKDSRIYPVPFYDATTEQNEQNILIPWLVDREVTKYAGTVEFALRFYEIDIDNQTYTFCLNTNPTKSKVLAGLETVNDELYDWPAEFMADILARLSELETDHEVYWVEVNQSLI